MLGAWKICDDDSVAEVSLSVLVAEVVDPGDALVSITRLVGTSPELAVAVLLATEVVDSSDVVEDSVDDAVVEVFSDDVVAAADELGLDDKTSSAFAHRFEGPRSARKTARTFGSPPRS